MGEAYGARVMQPDFFSLHVELAVRTPACLHASVGICILLDCGDHFTGGWDCHSMAVMVRHSQNARVLTSCPVAVGLQACRHASMMPCRMQDLCLYWLLYTEAANLRHTPEMLWFIFFTAHTSWQYKQVCACTPDGSTSRYVHVRGVCVCVCGGGGTDAG